jgi:hypothetical protein
MRRAPPDEVGMAYDAARIRLAGLGDDLEIEMSALGDRVGNVNVIDAHAPPTPPRTTADIKALATAALTSYADAFGLTRDEPARLHPRVKRVHDIPGVAWEVSAKLERTPTGPMPVRTGSGEIVVDIDRSGAIAYISVDDELLPPITVCDDTMTSRRLEAAVVGRPLQYTTDTGRSDEGTVAVDDITMSARRVMRIRGQAADGDLVVGAVYEVQINHEYLPWTMLVDPAAGVVIETTEL